MKTCMEEKGLLKLRLLQSFTRHISYEESVISLRAHHLHHYPRHLQGLTREFVDVLQTQQPILSNLHA